MDGRQHLELINEISNDIEDKVNTSTKIHQHNGERDHQHTAKEHQQSAQLRKRAKYLNHTFFPHMNNSAIAIDLSNKNG